MNKLLIWTLGFCSRVGSGISTAHIPGLTRMLILVVVPLCLLPALGPQWVSYEQVGCIVLGLTLGWYLHPRATSADSGGRNSANNDLIAQDISASQQAFAVLKQQVSATIQTSESAVFAMMERMTRVHSTTLLMRERIVDAVARSQTLSNASLSEAGRHSEAVQRLAEHQHEFDLLRRQSLDRVLSVANQVNQLIPLAGLISEISRQTNLISINASIESARAGEVGAGFKVVAAEVRRLSALTADAARQITDGTRAAATSIELELRHLREGVDDDSAAKLSEIAQHIQHTGDTLGEVVPYLSQLSTHMESTMQSVTGDIVETLGEMQFQDINRQLLEQINSALSSLSNHFSQLYELIDGHAPPPPLPLEELLQAWTTDYVMHAQRVAHALGTGRPAPAESDNDSDPLLLTPLQLSTGSGPKIELF